LVKPAGDALVNTRGIARHTRVTRCRYTATIAIQSTGEFHDFKRT
jgi:hypothetical protein